MERIRASDVISATFQFVRDHLRAVAVWSAINLVITIVMQLVMARFLTMQLTAARGGMTGLGAEQIIQGVLGFVLLYLVVIAVMIVLQAAVFRAALYPQLRETSYLRLGWDELRLFGLLVILGLGIMLAFILAIAVGAVVVAGLFALGSAFKIVAILIGVAGYIGLMVAPVNVIVRLASAGPLTILRGRITIGEAWRLTRGRFWTLFGSYFVVALVWTAAFGVLIPLSFGSAMQQGMMQQMLHPNDPLLKQQFLAMQIQQYGNLGPARWLPLAIGAIVGAVMVALQCGSIGIATRLLLDEAKPESVF
jgi:hypothetical protein